MFQKTIRYPQSSALAIYRRDCRIADGNKHGEETFPAGLFDASVGTSKDGLRCCVQRTAPNSASVRPRRTIGQANNHHTYDAAWRGIQFPQVPNYLFICFQKDSDAYNLDNPIAGVNILGGVGSSRFSSSSSLGGLLGVAGG